MMRPTEPGDKFAQAALDQSHEWRLKAIQKTDPHVVRVDYDSEARAYRGTFPISPDGRVTGRLDYVRVGTLDDAGDDHVNAGKFLVTTYPADSSRTLANLFDGGTVDALIVQVGASAETAQTARKIIEKVIEDTEIVNDLALVTKEARRYDPSPLDSADTAYVRINFHFTHGVATGWTRDSGKDVKKAALGAVLPGGMAVVQNGVILVGDRYSVKVDAFKNGSRFSGVDITKTGFPHHVTGMSYNRTGNKLALTQGGYSEAIKVFPLLQPGTTGQRLGTETNDSIAGSDLATRGSLAVWCVAWRDNGGNDLWVIDRSRFTRVFKNGSVTKNLTLPGTEQVYAATFVGDVLIYGGGGSAVYAYNVVTGQRVPELELTGLQVTAGLTDFGRLNGMAYDPVAEILYLGGRDGYVAAFAALKDATAFPEELYDYRTMSKTRLQEEALDAPAGDVEHSFKVVVAERQPGAARLKTLTFAEDGTHQSLYRVSAPFPDITSIEFDARAGAQQYRYQVRMPASAAQGGGIPVAIKVGSHDYPLAASSLGGGAEAVFTSPAVASAERVSDSALSRQIDVRYADGSWANGVAVARVPRTLTNTQLKHALAAPQNVTTFPEDPALGQRVNLVRRVTITGWGILSAALKTSGDFVGWYDGTSPTGALAEAPGNGIGVLGSFLPGTGQQANKAVVRVAGNTTRTPKYVWVNGRRHGVTPSGSSYWSIDRLDGSSFVAGQEYAVQVEWSDETTAYPERTFEPGDYTWNGSRWELSPETTTRPQNLAVDASSAVAAGKVVAIAADTDEFSLVPGTDPVAHAGSTARWPLAKMPIVKMTQAQYNAGVAANTIAAGQNVLYVIVG